MPTRAPSMSAAKSSAACSGQETNMSRIGKNPVPLPKGVTAEVTNGTVAVKGPKGELKLKLVPEVTADVKDGAIAVTPREQDDRSRAMWGMQRTLVNNLVKGVTEGYTEKLE